MQDYKDENTWLMHGDCLERMEEIPDVSVDLVLTDPPYGTTACKWDTVIDLEAMWGNLNRVAKPTAGMLLFASEPFASTLRFSNISNYRYDWYWHKNKPSGAMLAKKQPMKAIENVCVFYSNSVKYNPQMGKRSEDELRRLSKRSVATSGTELDRRAWGRTGNREDNKLKYPSNVIGIKTVANRSKDKVAHPTQKPVLLMEYLIKTYTNEGETVLDFTMGSGTTGVACKNLNRKFIGIEMDESYYEIAKNRILGEA